MRYCAPKRLTCGHAPVLSTGDVLARCAAHVVDARPGTGSFSPMVARWHPLAWRLSLRGTLLLIEAEHHARELTRALG